MRLRILTLLFILAFTFSIISCKSSTPKVDKVESERAEVEPGNTVKLTGQNFGEEQSRLQVTVGDKDASIKKVEGNSMEVELPADLNPGNHKIVVKNRETKNESTPVEVKIVVPSPKIATVSPDPATSGSVLQVEGRNFNPDETLMEATLDDQKVTVEKATAAIVEISIPPTLEPGKHELILTDLKTGKSSGPQPIQIVQLAQIPAGSPIRIRTTTPVGSEMSQQGDEVAMVLAAPLVIDGRTLAAAGSSVKGRITFVQHPGKVKGRAAIGFTVESIHFADNEVRPVQTDDFNSQAESGKKKDAKKIAITTGIGTLVGAIAGGKKGAAIGAATGAATGTTVVLLTKGDHVVVPENSVLDFVLQDKVEFQIREPLPLLTKK